MIRKLLHALYTVCGYASALFLAMIGVLTLVQIVSRQLGFAFEGTELAGFCLAASTFLGLAYTFVNGEHVRVGFVAGIRSDRVRYLAEIWCCCIGLLATGYATWQMTVFTAQTLEFGDLSPGMVAMPMWIPQSALAIGLGVMAIGCAEQLALVLTGREPSYAKAAATHGSD